MDLVSKQDLEQSDSGSRFIPDSALVLMHTDVLQAASDAFAKAVMENPNYELGCVYDQVKHGVTVYWKRVV